MPSLPAETPPCQTDKVSEALETLIQLILPLHQLLEAQAALEEGAAQQLADIVDSLVNLTASFETVLAGLSSLMASETLSPALQAALDRIESRQTRQQRALTEISGQLRMLTDWLGAPPAPKAGPD
ncbi:hypothetical protein ACFSDD_24110 [Salipiger marinus]|uniref:Uncharacterized protein n=1 Tax=Salipiger marinus TaxID=555512 RepID=A0A1G8TER9_9RHOB|nr:MULTISPECIES: hypothetical protein [Salipiger]MEB3421593.1 hypothetical protein [Salipiger manganoxidans]SDJ39923.1 hypothetical protein SAMN04487993_102945 [Salipiger marinus]